MEGTKGAAGSQRLFFGLWPDIISRQQIVQAGTALLANASGRAVDAANLHCTLMFLGAVTTDQRVCVEAVASTVNEDSFDLRLDRFGYFQRPRVAWVGSTEIPRPLSLLVRELSEGCLACGFSSDQRNFAAHVTIARRVERDPGRPMMLPITWSVDRFALIESVSSPAGVQYQPLRFWSLGDPRTGK